MSEQIQAYFQTEDQAEGAKTSLIGYKTENLEVSRLETTIGRNRNLQLPLVAFNPSGNINTAGSLGVPGTGGIAGNNIVPIMDDIDDRSDVESESNINKTGDLTDAGDVDTNDYDNLKYVLVAKVEDEHYDEIIQKLRQNGAHIEALPKT
ncbi:hypothetical protein [Paenibacillus crassostreae]|uniref:Uncharacterized protein n=1 Tax=Paenibacillus crassostreae TaxID=1763538 RepID=A0A167CHJ5_9BACL|nr:hypothetical protein [Paenibacillus crassostreae]AOZ91873.1 hypothetical protein LPB68_06280 [Paenibacillus crassostreae]OAB73204.1 hypothetical protein PNBC_14010 [Paenibacillus crassostreae]